MSPLAEEECEALLCGHTFHTLCINRYVQATGRSKENACSFKCRLREDTVDADARQNSLITAANEAAMRANADPTTTLISDHDEDEEAESTPDID